MNNDEQYDKFLPLGSIVTIKGHQQPVMIIKIHYSKDVDYLAVEHPIGFESMDKLFKFQIEDVEKVHFLGRINKEVEANLLKTNFMKIRERNK